MRFPAQLLTIFLLCACGDDTPATTPDLGTPFRTLAAGNAVQSPSDPLAPGMEMFLYETWGTERVSSWPPADFMLALMKSEPSVFGNQYASFGFVPDPNDDFPVGFKRGTADPTRVHETCALCHVGRLPDGRLWIGEPNRDLDFGRFAVEVNKRWVAAGHPSMMSDLAVTKSLALGPGRTDAESGDYPYAVPADFPPYWTLGARTALNYLGTGKNVRTEAYLSLYTFGAGAPNDATATVPFPSEDRLMQFLAYFGSFAPPPAPAGDAKAIAAGAQVFEAAHCDACHHVGQVASDGIVTYPKDATVGELLPGADPMFPRGTILTDKAHRVLIDGSGLGGGSGAGDDGGASSVDGGIDAGVDTGYMDLIQFIEDHGLQVRFSDGYATLDLRALWATAPYLHDGSVPTLADLLAPPSQRPAQWMRGTFPVDTTTYGNGNGGHAWGTDLSAADKAALVAYLMSL